MGKWHDIASEGDKLAQNFYTQLVAQKMEADGWQESWVELPKELYISFSRGIHENSVSYLWDGFEWRPVAHYIREPGDNPERVYLRLLANGELAEETRVVEVLAH
jgi:hypothetical protein